MASVQLCLEFPSRFRLAMWLHAVARTGQIALDDLDLSIMETQPQDRFLVRPVSLDTDLEEAPPARLLSLLGVVDEDGNLVEGETEEGEEE